MAIHKGINEGETLLVTAEEIHQIVQFDDYFWVANYPIGYMVNSLIEMFKANYFNIYSHRVPEEISSLLIEVLPNQVEGLIKQSKRDHQRVILFESTYAQNVEHDYHMYHMIKDPGLVDYLLSQDFSIKKYDSYKLVSRRARTVGRDSSNPFVIDFFKKLNFKISENLYFHGLYHELNEMDILWTKNLSYHAKQTKENTSSTIVGIDIRSNHLNLYSLGNMSRFIQSSTWVNQCLDYIKNLENTEETIVEAFLNVVKLFKLYIDENILLFADEAQNRINKSLENYSDICLRELNNQKIKYIGTSFSLSKRSWLQQFVLEANLCPSIHYDSVSTVTSTVLEPNLCRNRNVYHSFKFDRSYQFSKLFTIEMDTLSKLM